ncbi:Putative membrane protein [Sphingopyxis fribergensis]|uniref:Putative membrane protein n=1 Tax=Sphingopyxis fribergensis TaxID=1515612 RepID=A0A0A7PCI5_9SPHN|nr:Putative membrane protein [Sphingopyxis fribergensis]
MPSVFWRSAACFSPRPTRTASLPRSLADGSRVALHAGGAVLALLSGVVLTSLITSRSTRFRRSVALLVAGLFLGCGFVLLHAGPAYGAILLIASAMGAAHCLFEQDAAPLRDTLLPSVQAVRLGEALAAGRLRETRRSLAFWLVFVVGGMLGAGAWFLTDRWALVLAAGFAFCAAIGARQLERFRSTDGPSNPNGA